MPERLILIDGSHAFYRAFYAIRGLATSKGMPTNAIYGFTTMLAKILNIFEPKLVAVAFDAAGPTFRERMYQEYKANRPEMPEDLSIQIPYLKKIPAAYGVRTTEQPGLEADDVIGTIAARAVEEGHEVIIITGDKDFMQLVTKRVTDKDKPGILLYDDMRERWIGIDEVIDKFGVPPERVIDVLAIMGDAVDNVPGVAGIGEKTAPRLVQEYGSVEEILARLNRVRPERLRGLLQRGREDALLSKKLVRIEQDAHLGINLQDLVRREADRDTLRDLFRELEFGRLLKEVQAETTPPEINDPPREQEGIPAPIRFDRYRAISTEEELGDLLETLPRHDLLCIDLKTDSPDPMRARIVGISLCAREAEACYIPVGHRYLGAPSQLPCGSVLRRLKSILEDGKIRKIGQNISYDALVLRRHGVRLKNLYFDTLVGAYLLDPDHGPHNLERISATVLHHTMTPTYEEVTGSGRKRVTFDQVEIARARDYSCQDADVTFRAWSILEKRLQDENLHGLFYELEAPLIECLMDMEENGVGIDTDCLKRLSRYFEQRLHGLIREVFTLVGEEFNIDSPVQLRRILFEKLKLRPGHRTKTGFSTDMSVLEKLAMEHPVPEKLMEYRQIAKLKNTYVDTLPALIHPETGRIHTSYNQAIAATGRLTSSEPNLQNIPIRTPDGREIRRAFVPRKGWVLISADYSQIELRVLAHLSRDPRLIRAFQEGRDIHRATAADISGVSPDQVTDEMRRKAKEVNFGIVYGITAFGLAKRLGIERRSAQEMIDLYFNRYPAVRAFIDETLKEARHRGWVKTLFGRKRWVSGPKAFADITSRNGMIRSQGERIAMNAPIQGTAADIMKKAMIAVNNRLHQDHMKSQLILQVHDELVVEAPESERERAMKLLEKEMEGVLDFAVPLKVDMAAGVTWADLKS